MNSSNVSQYLLYRLHELGAKQLFGVCGDFLLGFMEQITKSPVKQINCCNELNAGYAADGYARIHGLGVVATTFTVGELSAINAIAGSYAEHIPVVMIAGAPERRHQLSGKMLHHTLGDYAIAREMFQKVTVDCVFLDDPENAPHLIDEAFQKCLYYKKPIYFELPADMVIQKCKAPAPFIPLEKMSDPESLDEAVNKSYDLLAKAKRPMILLGFEIIRHGLQEKVQKLLEKSGFPFCAFPTAKATLSEYHSQFIGCYKGDWSREAVKKAVNDSDAVLMLGGFFIDSDTGGFTARLEEHPLIQANFEQVKIKQDLFKNVLLKDFIIHFTEKCSHSKMQGDLVPASIALKDQLQYTPNENEKLKTARFFKRIASFLKPHDIVVADVGDCLYSTTATLFPENTTYVTQSFYNSIGYSVGAALGTSVNTKRRTLLFVGDGSFQISAQEISTMINYDCKTIVFLLNNDGYGIERAIHDGPYNDLAPWRYYLVPEAFGGEKGIVVKTEGDLEKALQMAEKASKLIFIEIQVDKFDFGETLKKAGAAMAENSKHSYE